MENLTREQILFIFTAVSFVSTLVGAAVTRKVNEKLNEWRWANVDKTTETFRKYHAEHFEQDRELSEQQVRLAQQVADHIVEDKESRNRIEDMFREIRDNLRVNHR